MSRDLILGTAGHIDHGKTTLIKRLTGVDTDRLPEEKRRGITIELGFAELELGQYRLGIVDVPGHERFVRQMLAGASGVDLALLVIAADDSVKPQTREHLDVLRLLDLRAGVIALTKCDVAEPDWIGLVEEEVRELVASTFLETAPIVRTSAHTGAGIDDLKLALEQAAERVTGRTSARKSRPFRMAIDRSFTLVGHGTVVTGSVATGQVSVGDPLVIEPGRIEVRVRSLHNHDREVETVAAGQRAAINLAGIHHEQVGRGHELAAAGHLVPSRLMTVWLDVLPSAPRPLKRRDRVRLHLGTAEVLASVVPLGGDAIQPGQSGAAQVFLSQSVVSTWNQPFVVRTESPVVTVAGGRVLVPAASKLRAVSAQDLDQLQQLRSSDALKRAAAAIYFRDPRDRDTVDLSRTAGVEDSRQVCEQLVQTGEVLLLAVSGHRQVLLHRRRIDEYVERVTKVLGGMHDANPLQGMFERATVGTKFRYLGSTVVLDAVFEEMVKRGRLRMSDRTVGLADRGPKLSKGEQQLLQQIVQSFQAGGFQPPSVTECEQQAKKNQSSVRSLIALAVSNGDLVEFGDKLFLHVENEARLRTIVTDAFREQPELTVSEIRELLGTTRKYAVPICSYLDRAGVTIRDGDVRRLSSSGRQATV